jgi:hypothetical protein
MRDKLFRYFRGNTAPIFCISLAFYHKGGYLRCKCANSDGFWWHGLHITWRIPYFEGFKWDKSQKRWVVDTKVKV